MRLRTNPRTYTFSIVTGLILLGLASMPAQAQNGKDSSFIKDNPIVARLDSLATLAFFNNNDFTTNRDVLNKYHFPVDSIPVYSDSVYRARIDELNQSSPFQFVYNDQTKAYIELYAYKKRKLISRMMGLAELYFPMFEEQLDIYNVPLEMKYLAIIESALNPIARSRVGASGLWQFMLGTGKLYGLNVTSYVDDRFDPYKSTVAACRHMRDLYNIYHDWALVLAAYNAGSGTVNRAIRLSGLDSTSRVTYWNIRPYLPVETQNYVPSFIGIAYIMSYPAEHNLYPSAPDYFYESVDTITLRKNYTLNQIASYLCIPIEQVQFLNPSYRKGIIPATASTPYVLRLPRAAMADFVNNQENIYAYKSPAEIQAAKDLAAASVIKPPVTNTTTTTAQTNTTVNKPQTNTTVVKAPVPQQTQTTANNASNYNKYVYHTVQRGDSLWSIAGRYKGASVDEIRRLNGLKVNSTIYPGQKLKIGITG
jgi:membrane-bound lytic murein transglycosylase D